MAAVITPGPDGMITREQAAELCGVSPDTISQWASRGYTAPDGQRRKLPVRRYKGRVMLNPVEVQKAEYATRKRARRAA